MALHVTLSFFAPAPLLGSGAPVVLTIISPGSPALKAGDGDLGDLQPLSASVQAAGENVGSARASAPIITSKFQ